MDDLICLGRDHSSFSINVVGTTFLSIFSQNQIAVVWIVKSAYFFTWIIPMSVVFNLGIIFQPRTSFRLKSSIVGISLWNIELIARFMRINDWLSLSLFNIGKTNLHLYGVFVINWLCL